LMRQPHSRKVVKVQTKTYTTEKEAKKAAARAYRPAILRLPNGRYACFQAGDALPQGARLVAGALTGGVRITSRGSRVRRIFRILGGRFSLSMQ